MTRTHRLMLITLASGLCVAIATAGPLTPPSAPASSYKTLSEVEPRTAINSTNTPGNFSATFRITQPGSYYLTGNITGSSGKFGIEVVASNVTIDLNGFTLQGTSGSLEGINVGSGSGFVLRNGIISGWGSDGLRSQRGRVRVENVVFSDNAGRGAAMNAPGSVVVSCVASGNALTGFSLSGSSVATDCVAQNNGTTTSHYGFSAADDAQLTRCVATGNTGTGIDVNQRGRVIDCQASFNTVNGISTYIGGSITGCVAGNNTLDGIHVGEGATVRNNHCNSNGDDGIQLDDNCTAIGNNCRSNGPSAEGAGIYIVGTGCRVEENHLIQNNYGILCGLATTNNFIVKNTARSNSGGNFNVSAGNDMAPVITDPAAAFTGATAWSNFAF